MNQVTLQQNITDVLGVNTLVPEEQSAFLDEVGDVILETAFLRLLSILSNEQQVALDAYLDTKPDGTVLLTHLLEHYAMFETILEEVVLEFKQDAVDVLSKEK